VAAIEEEEWVKQGIGFKPRAEMGTFGSWKSSATSGHGNHVNAGGATQNVGGASILNDSISKSLIYDQYDRVLKEQKNDALQSKARKIQADRDLQKETDAALSVQGYDAVVDAHPEALTTPKTSSATSQLLLTLPTVMTMVDCCGCSLIPWNLSASHWRSWRRTNDKPTTLTINQGKGIY
jgi:hypothetical protein